MKNHTGRLYIEIVYWLSNLSSWITCLSPFNFINMVVLKLPVRVESVPMQYWEPELSPLCKMVKDFTAFVVKKSLRTNSAWLLLNELPFSGKVRSTLLSKYLAIIFEFPERIALTTSSTDCVALKPNRLSERNNNVKTFFIVLILPDLV